MGAPHRLPPDDEATLAGSVTTRHPGSSDAATSAGASAPLLESGTVLAERYEILAVLGEGGMGAVYKAHDRELDRTVALKTIRPEMAASSGMLARFKQEVLLASRITHPNVIRLYDLGEAAGVKFITMEFIEGEDLRSLLLSKGKLLPADAVEVISQVCLALDAAHAQGVIHRDLKPQNVMREPQGRVVVMDFGLARATGAEGMTQTGALVGTMEYMAPEQAMAGKADQRSDIFAVGLILYESLTGKMPYAAESALASLLKRSQERAIPASDVDNTVPRPLSNIVGKCLERDPDKRYQSVKELLSDLDRQVAVVPAKIVLHPWLPRKRRTRLAILAAVLLLLLAVAIGFALRRGFLGSKTQVTVGPAVSIAVLPLRNASGDPSLAWLGSSLAETLGTDIGQSAQVHPVAAERIRQILQDLRIPPDSELDSASLRRLANFSSADMVLSGQYARLGDQIRVDLTLNDLQHGRTVPLNAQAPEKDVLSSVDALAKSVRANLNISRSAMHELEARSFKPSTQSVAALRAYSEGVDLLRSGRNQEALDKFKAATGQDANFALAWSKLAQAYANLGYANEAEQASRRAVDLSRALPEPEKYRIDAEHARVTNDYGKAIAAYEKLASVLPDDTELQSTLADLYQRTGAFDKAREQYTKVLQHDPKSLDAHLGLATVELLRNNPQAALDPLNEALSLAVQLNRDEQRARALHAMGVAYRELGKPEDAMRYYQEAFDVRSRLGQKQGMADSLHAMAQVNGDEGKFQQAVKEYQQAIQLQREIGDNQGLGNTLVDLGGLYEDRGEYDNALGSFKEALQLEHAVGDNKAEAVALNNIGTVYFFKAQYEDARTYYEQALHLRETLNVPGDIADTLHNLAEVSTNMGDYDQALAQYLRALDLRRKAGDDRGAAQDSYSMGILFEHQGRYGAALNAMSGALKTMRSQNEHGYWLGEILSGYGNTLSEAGRQDEAEKNLAESLAVARELKNIALEAQTLNYEGDRVFFKGDYAGAQKLYAQALPLAKRAKDDRLLLLTNLNLAKAAVRTGRPQSAIGNLRSLATKADSMGLGYLSVAASTYLAEGLLAMKDHVHAAQELERALNKAEKLGMQSLQAQDHYLLGSAQRLAGNESEAKTNFATARRMLEEMRKESGSDAITQRSDLASINNAT